MLCRFNQTEDTVRHPQALTDTDKRIMELEAALEHLISATIVQDLRANKESRKALKASLQYATKTLEG